MEFLTQLKLTSVFNIHDVVRYTNYSNNPLLIVLRFYLELNVLKRIGFNYVLNTFTININSIIIVGVSIYSS